MSPVPSHCDCGIDAANKLQEMSTVTVIMLAAIFTTLIPILALLLAIYMNVKSRRPYSLRSNPLFCPFYSPSDRPVQETQSYHKSDASLDHLTSDSTNNTAALLPAVVERLQCLKSNDDNSLCRQTEETGHKILSSVHEDVNLNLNSSSRSYSLVSGTRPCLPQEDSSDKRTEMPSSRAKDLSVTTNTNRGCTAQVSNTTVRFDGRDYNNVSACVMPNDHFPVSDVESESLFLLGQPSHYSSDEELKKKADSSANAAASVINLRTDSLTLAQQPVQEQVPIQVEDKRKDRDLCCIIVARFDFVRRIQHGDNDEVEVMVSGLEVTEGRRLIEEALLGASVQTRVDISDRSDGRWSPIRTVIRD